MATSLADTHIPIYLPSLPSLHAYVCKTGFRCLGWSGLLARVIYVDYMFIPGEG